MLPDNVGEQVGIPFCGILAYHSAAQWHLAHMFVDGAHLKALEEGFRDGCVAVSWALLHGESSVVAG